MGIFCRTGWGCYFYERAGALRVRMYHELIKNNIGVFIFERPNALISRKGTSYAKI